MSPPSLATDDWFSVTDLGDGLTWITEPRAHPFIRCNIWHLRGSVHDVVIDTGLGLVSMLSALPHLLRDRRVLAVATHYHYDHVGGLHEFAERAIHHREAAFIRDSSTIGGTLHTRTMSGATLAELREAGYELPDDTELVDAVPATAPSVEDYAVTPCSATRLLDDGDVIDLGDRELRVLHLPGHSPGSIGLFDEDRGALFSGDAVYDGPLLDFGTGTDRTEYVATMRRLRELPVRVVHGGHEPSFGPERLRQICDDYITRRWEAT